MELIIAQIDEIGGADEVTDSFEAEMHALDAEIRVLEIAERNYREWNRLLREHIRLRDEGKAHEATQALIDAELKGNVAVAALACADGDDSLLIELGLVQSADA